MKRRDFVKSAALGAAGCALSPHVSRAASSRPNVLLILVDQMRTPRWTPLLETPNISRLAEEGVSFTNHFAAASTCSPSRACLFTGLHTSQHNVLQNCDFADKNPSLDPAITTMGHLFRDAGYRTPYKGKWHLTLKKDRHLAAA